METRNPFAFGRVVGGETFCNRRVELADLRQAARSGRSLWLHSPRRFGKTSLLLEAFADTAIPFAYVDTYAVQDLQGLAEAWLRGVSRLLTRVLGPSERALRWLAQSAVLLAPQLTVDAGGSVTLTLGTQVRSIQPAHLDEIVDLPQRLASQHDLQVAVAVDEFQEVARLKQAEHLLRARLQHHDRVSYLFSGSRRSLLADLFSDRSRPFFQFAEHYPLGPIPASELALYIQGRFASTGLDIDADRATRIVALAEAHPHYTQMIASRVWEQARRGHSTGDPELALDALARSQDLANRRWFDQLSPTMRKVVLHVSRHGGAELLSEDVRSASRLGPASTVQRALAGLGEREDLVREPEGTWRIADPVLARWLLLLQDDQAIAVARPAAPSEVP